MQLNSLSDHLYLVKGAGVWPLNCIHWASMWMAVATANPSNFRPATGLPVLLGGTSHPAKYPPLPPRPPLLYLPAYTTGSTCSSATAIFSQEQKAALWLRRRLPIFLTFLCRSHLDILCLLHYRQQGLQTRQLPRGGLAILSVRHA